MATNTENVNIKINVSADDSMKSVKQMRLELRSMMTQMDEAAAAGDKVKFNELKKNIGELRNDIKDLNQEMKFSDPGEFLAGFTQVAKGAVAGFGAVTGAMELFGASTEDVQEVQKKSMVIIQTLQSLEEVRSLLEAKGAIKGLANSAMRVLGLTGEVVATEAVAGANVQATATQWSWNAAMAANPIGVVIVAVAALAAGIYALTKVMGDNNIETEDYNVNLADVQESTRKTYSTIAELKMQLARKQGKITDEDFNKWKANEENKVRLTEIFNEKSRKIREAEGIYQRNWNKIIEEGKNLDTVELNKLLNAESDKLAKEKEKINIASGERIKSNTKLYVEEILLIHEDAKKQEVKTEKKAVDTKVEFNEWYYEELRKNRKAFTAEEEKDLKSNLGYINERMNAAFANSDTRLAAEKEYFNQLNDLRQQNADSDKERRDLEIEELDLKYADDMIKYADNEDMLKEIIEAKEQEKKDIKIKYAQETMDKVNSILSMGSDFVSSLQEMEMAGVEEAGKNEIGGKERVEAEKKAIQKKYAGVNAAISIAQIGINTAQAIVRAFSDLGPIGGAIASVLIGGVGIAQTAIAVKQYQNIMKLRRGGLLSGPSHEQGGIGIGNGYEAEGGEAILNKKSMSIPAFRSLASAINVAGGGVPLSNNASAGITASIDTNVIEEIVSRVTNNIASIPVNVTEYDITKMQRKVAVIETRSTY